MSTTNIDTWQVPLAEIGPLYPFVGWEWLFVVLAVALWVSFHIWQAVNENREFREDAERLSRAGGLADAIEKE
ncbi:MAG: hypothetical protein RIE31_11020 [Alphaproteobacteria bacterium]